ncbi:hypothetical protein BK709_13650 [Bacillus thuringiensis serovar shandongiensis]|uniref:hypothetical protein n=1 Tax=Bacillus toyonensis TaxID=155322 RepID=UPI000B430110|nr:hypothetical protein [Bacillus toyonensis]MEC2394854.1 hypothetical protein [Bacillus toyonensis]OTX35386.1 hypothetical protein BK717_14735 [Bacillus thuringiensis serovar malayensis]OUB07090.1 hypothetical protein BK709_13650 [Bacillus thuringiensis serovar shandongiensis]
MNREAYYPEDDNNHDNLFPDIEDFSSMSTEESYPSSKSFAVEKEVSRDVSFCCVVNIPPGFEYVPQGKNKIVYSLDQLSVIKETCMKTINVERVGPVEVNLNILKVIGCIPFVVNAELRGECGEHCDSSLDPRNHIFIGDSGSLCVDNILKLSVATLPDYHLNGHNVIVSAFHITPVYEVGCHLLRFTGKLTFQNIPHK